MDQLDGDAGCMQAVARHLDPAAKDIYCFVDVRYVVTSDDRSQPGADGSEVDAVCLRFAIGQRNHLQIGDYVVLQNQTGRSTLIDACVVDRDTGDLERGDVLRDTR